MQEIKNYFLGLDIGTNSVGYAATDENYRLLSKRGKDLWGVELFDTAETAQERRTARGARRLRGREKVRISLLQELFAKEIAKVDDKFFIRLKASALWEDDKEASGIFSRNSLFFENSLTDKDFFKKYPTIYHLRRKLTTEPAEDVRFLYLAIANMMKHRGNFLFDSFSTNNDGDNLATLFKNLKNTISQKDDDGLAMLEFSVGEEQSKALDALDELIAKKPFKTSALVEEFKNIFGEMNSNQKALLSAICGGTVNAKTIFSSKTNELNLTAKLDSFNVDDAAFDTFLVELEGENEAASTIIAQAKAIYDHIIFKRLMGGHNFVCDALVEKFELHKTQLKNFKEVIKKYYKDKYKEVFKENRNGLNNYAKYIDGTNRDAAKDDKKMANKCTRADFYKYIKSVLNQNPEAQNLSEVAEILSSIDENNFLPKLRTSANSVIPYQVNSAELNAILNKSKEKFTFLNETDEDGLSVAGKIISIFEFRIPYFVGPLSKNGSKNAWIERRTDEKIMPWNIKEVVDFDKSEQAFIKRMQNNCTYLRGEACLPKNSLLYSEYMVLNELNNIRINKTYPLSQSLKEKIIEVMKTVGAPKLKDIKTMVYGEGKIKPEDEVVITGVDGKLNSNLNIYKNFNAILDGEIEKYREEVEDIILHASYTSDKTRLYDWLKKTYGKTFSEAQIKTMKGLKIEGFGKFSRKLLDGIIGVDTKTGESHTIIEWLRCTNLNFMEIINAFDFGDAFANPSVVGAITYDDVSGLYCSPSVKRGVWQAIKIIREMQKIGGGAPRKIFVEVTRADDEAKKGKAPDSRKDRMIKVYNSIKKAFDDSVNDLKTQLTQEENLNSDKLYLYYTQLGKCAYTGKTIDVNMLFSNAYDIDHIIPRSKVKDDSLDNKVLVLRDVNIDKANRVLTPEIQANMKPFWQLLNSYNLISNEKLARLLRTREYSEDEQKDFAASQLVSTNQSAKAVIELIKAFMPKTAVVYSKAKLVTEFRNGEFKFENGADLKDLSGGAELKMALIKNRELNNFHHAKDAYLNIVVGNVFDEKYSKRFYLRNSGKVNYNVCNAFTKEIAGVFNQNLHLPIIKEVMLSNTPHVSFLAREETGAFYKETRWGSEKHQKDFKNVDEIRAYASQFKRGEWDASAIALKGESAPLSQTIKYGSYHEAKYAYFSVVDYISKKKKQRKFVAIPYFFAKDIKAEADLIGVIKKLEKVDDVKIVIPKVKIGTIIKVGSGRFKVAGKSGEQMKLHNFNEIYLEPEFNEYFKLLSKTLKLMGEKKPLRIEGEAVVVNINRFGEKAMLTKPENLVLYKALVGHMRKAIYKETSLNSTAKSLKENAATFEGLTIENQLVALQGVLNILTGKSGGDISLVGGSRRSGELNIPLNVSNKKPLSLVFESPTGYFVKEVSLNGV